MKLYHGTSEQHLEHILKNGLKPRSIRKSNWDIYPSRPDMVYLTNAYAPYFAISSAKEHYKPVVLEIEIAGLNIDKFYPDEDFIAQALAQVGGQPIRKYHKEVRKNLEGYQKYWQASLEQLGNCCYQGDIPPENIVRYVVWNIASQSYFSGMALDPIISIINYTIMQNKYKGLIEWLFGDRENFPPSLNDEIQSKLMDSDPYFKRMMEHSNAVSKNRRSIVVNKL